MNKNEGWRKTITVVTGISHFIDMSVQEATDVTWLVGVSSCATGIPAAFGELPTLGV